MAYSIRPATPIDAGGIAHVARKTWAATYDGIIPAAIQSAALTAWYAEERLAQAARNPATTLLVAVAASGEVVGFAQASPRQEPGDAELWRFYVLPEHQGQGLGRRLLRAALEGILAKQPIERLYVQVEAENEIGRRAYEALGFTYHREYANELMGHPTTMCEMWLQVP